MSRHYNSEQYIRDLLAVTDDPEMIMHLKALIEGLSDIDYEAADMKYGCRKYPQKSLSFYMTGRCTDYLRNLSGEAFRILHYLASYMSQDNLCIAPTKTISELLNISIATVERCIKDLKDAGAIFDTGKRYHRSCIYEVDQDYVSYGVRPKGFTVINDTYVPVIQKVYIESNDPERPKVMYVGDIQKIQPQNVVGFNKKHRSKTDSEALNESHQMTPEELLEGLI